MYLNTQHKLYFKVFNGGEVKPPPMKSISDPRFALPRLPPVLRSSVVPLVPTVNNCHNCDRGNIVTWCTQHTRHNGMQYYVWQLRLLHNLGLVQGWVLSAARSKGGLTKPRTPSSLPSMQAKVFCSGQSVS